MANVVTVQALLTGDASKLISTVKNAEDSIRGVQGASEKAGNTGTSLFSKVGGVIGKIVGIAGAATSAVGGIMAFGTLSAGLKRLESIQNATVALTGMLGSQKAAADLTGKALAVVQGTPFAFPQFAQATQLLVSFGMSAQKVPPLLTAIADAAGASGLGAGAVDQLSAAFAKMTASGKIGGDVLQSLSLAGVNGLGILANGMGVTTEQASKMISEGLVPASKATDMLINGIEKGSDGAAGHFRALAGQAQAAGLTVSGSIDNMHAAVARMGASALGPVMAELPNLLNNGLIPAFDGLGAVLAVLAQKFVDTGWIKSFAGSLAKVGPVLKTFAQQLKGMSIGDWIKSMSPIGTILAALTPIFPILGHAIEQVLPPLAQLIQAFTGALGTAIQVLVPPLATLAQIILPVLANVLQGVIIAITPFAPLILVLVAAFYALVLVNTILDAVMAINPFIAIAMAIIALVGFIVWLATQTTFFQQVWAVMVAIVGAAWTWLWGILQPIFQAIGDIFTWIWNSIIMPIVTLIVAYVMLWANIYMWLWNSILMPIFQAIGAIFTWLWNNVIMVIVVLIIAYVVMWANIYTWLWNSIISPIFALIGAIFKWIWNSVIKPVIDFIVAAFKLWQAGMGILGSYVGVILHNIGAFFEWVWNSVISPVIEVIKSAIHNWQTVMGAVGSAIGSILHTLGGVFEWIWNSVISPVKNFIVNAVNSIHSAFANTFATIGGIIRGAFSGVVGFVEGVMNGIIDTVNGVIGAINSAGAVARAVTGGAVNVHVGSIPHFAGGGTIHSSGYALVGEKGPEIVKLPGGSHVYPHGETPTGTQVIINVNGANMDLNALADKIMQKVRFAGGM